ncbi:MAG: DUF1858 domain-containing protein [Eubacteriales bacterium]
MDKIRYESKVYDIINKYPDVKDIMVQLGFSDITKPGMLNTAGRVMTLEKGAKMKGIDLRAMTEKFAEYGYELIKEDDYE